ncbi:MAG: hypothetical protein ACRDHU_06250 [Actinomycetota bacterium]
MSDPAGPPKRSHRHEIVATVLLALAAVATAWSSYQAARWTAEQTKAFSAANASRANATQASDRANAETQVDVAIFVQWVDAQATDATALADFYRTRFRAEFIPAFDAWLATDPFEDPDAPLTPFAMPEYRVAKAEEADRLNATAEASAADAREYIQRATNYVLGVVLFAVSLFFAAVSTKIDSGRLRTTVLVFGCIVFLGTLSWIATFPVSLSI